MKFQLTRGGGTSPWRRERGAEERPATYGPHVWKHAQNTRHKKSKGARSDRFVSGQLLNEVFGFFKFTMWVVGIEIYNLTFMGHEPAFFCLCSSSLSDTSSRYMSCAGILRSPLDLRCPSAFHRSNEKHAFSYLSLNKTLPALLKTRVLPAVF